MILLERIKVLIDIRGENECWPWKGTKQRTGHGQVHWRGKTCGVHRVVYVLIKGPISPKLEVMHTCNNSSCVNPKHLVTGTHAENQAHMSKSGRAGRKKKVKT